MSTYRDEFKSCESCEFKHQVAEESKEDTKASKHIQFEEFEQMIVLFEAISKCNGQ
jgi:hypothetical protein